MGHSLLFPPFRLDQRERSLFRDGTRVILRPKSFAVLEYLVEHAGQILSKQEILAAVWFGLQVDPAALKVCIREIRERLEEDPRTPRYIATVHRHGYRFIAPISREAAGEQATSAAAYHGGPPYPSGPASPVGPAAPASVSALGARWPPTQDVAQPEYGRPPPSPSVGRFPQPPGGAFAPPWYAVREQEERLALGYLEVPGAPALLLGPERFGKTWLMKSVLGHVRRQDGPHCQILDIDLAHFDEQARATPAAYLRALTRRIAAQAGVPPPQEDDLKQGDPLERITDFLEQQVLRRGPERVVLALDTMDAVFGCSFGQDVLGLVRLWADLAATEPWSRLRLILSLSTTAALLAGVSELTGVIRTAPLGVGELRDYQVRQLAERHGLCWTPDECRAATALLGGHPYLLRLLMHGVACRQVSLGDVLQQRWQAVTLFDDYLQGLRRRVERHPTLMEALHALDAPAADHEARLYVLSQAGLLRQMDGGGYCLRCPLYARIFARSPTRGVQQ